MNIEVGHQIRVRSDAPGNAKGEIGYVEEILHNYLRIQLIDCQWGLGESVGLPPEFVDVIPLNPNHITNAATPDMYPHRRLLAELKVACLDKGYLLPDMSIYPNAALVAIAGREEGGEPTTLYSWDLQGRLIGQMSVLPPGSLTGRVKKIYRGYEFDPVGRLARSFIEIHTPDEVKLVKDSLYVYPPGLPLYKHTCHTMDAIDGQVYKIQTYEQREKLIKRTASTTPLN